ncbi:hypothetical protein QTO30_10885 [Yoonia sp. GPGPB17]|uniref:hypothetical protein n=1 Tax=Yoonia sp. GPGPB17 TaxID=3026147 RepID=UPI0030C0F850
MSEIWAVVIGAVAFVLGRIYSQSEAILVEKRRVYEQFLLNCPRPNQAYSNFTDDEYLRLHETMEKSSNAVALYAAPPVMLAISVYLEEFEKAANELDLESEALHPAFKRLAKAHNDLILEMRRDGLAWSVFGYKGKSRLPPDALEQAKKKSLE